MNTRTRWLFTPVCLALTLTLSVSCGRKTEPLTPQSPRPEAVKGIKAVVRDAVAFLSWSVPTKNVEGKDMNPAEILGFRIYRAEIGDGRKKLRYREIADITMANLRRRGEGGHGFLERQEPEIRSGVQLSDQSHEREGASHSPTRCSGAAFSLAARRTLPLWAMTAGISFPGIWSLRDRMGASTEALSAIISTAVRKRTV
jgi:hypothetical protein